MGLGVYGVLGLRIQDFGLGGLRAFGGGGGENLGMKGLGSRVGGSGCRHLELGFGVQSYGPTCSSGFGALDYNASLDKGLEAFWTCKCWCASSP